MNEPDLFGGNPGGRTDAAENSTATESTTRPLGQPLAERLRPTSIDQVVGQAHLLTVGKPLRVALDAG
ncbi:MAG: recombination factor protein RarA, partial [Burkholderiaceae bacterium]